MRPLKVHVLLINVCLNSHIEILLEQDNLFYSMNIWEKPADLPSEITEKMKNMQSCACQSLEFSIRGDINAVADDWKEHVKDIGNKKSCCFNNCADATQWFLEKYGNIQKPRPCSAPVSCNHYFCCFFIPSFLNPGCCTLPGRVFDNARSKLAEPASTIYSPVCKIK